MAARRLTAAAGVLVLVAAGMASPRADLEPPASVTAVTPSASVKPDKANRNRGTHPGPPRRTTPAR